MAAQNAGKSPLLNEHELELTTRGEKGDLA
jgi:hypothetical protein